MSKQEPSLTKKALDYIYAFFEAHGKPFVYHSYAYITEHVRAFKEIAKGVHISKPQYELGMLAVAFKDVGRRIKPEDRNR